MNKIKTVGLLTCLLFTATLLSSCKWAILNPQGPIAAAEKHLLVFSFLIMLTVVVPVILLSLIFAWRYRASNQKATYAPDWSHSTLLEIIWWSIPCIIIAVLGTITWYSSHDLDPYKPLTSNTAQPLTIQAIALEWKWLFIYPEQNIATVNFIQLPANVPINFMITAEGPMNSFQIPQLAGQIYAMAGMQTQLHLIANTPGEYRGISANFSGDGFSDMKFTVRVSSQVEFEQWVNHVRASPNRLSMQKYEQLMKPSINNKFANYSSVTKSLFNVVVMKGMMPMETPKTLTENVHTSREHPHAR